MSSSMLHRQHGTTLPEAYMLNSTILHPRHLSQTAAHPVHAAHCTGCQRQLTLSVNAKS
jgi:hypothetical protein